MKGEIGGFEMFCIEKGVVDEIRKANEKVIDEMIQRNIVIKDIKQVKTMNTQEKNWINRQFKKCEYLRFYRSSGTAVLTNVKPKDFEELYYVPRDMIPYIMKNPEILENVISAKKKRKMNKKEKLKEIMERVKQIDRELIRLEREIRS